MVCVVPKAAAPANFSTTFPATENPMSQGGLWKQGLADGLDWGDMQTTPGKCFATRKLGDVNDDFAHRTGSWPDAQYAEGVVYLAGGYTAGHEIELHVRSTITAHNVNAYELYWDPVGNHALTCWNGGPSGFRFISAAGAGLGVPVDGDTVRLEIDTAFNLTVKKNGTTVLTGTDSNVALRVQSGSPGIGADCGTLGTQSSYGWKSYSCGAA